MCEVTTGDHLAAGTDANVYIEVIGSSGTSGRLPLEKSENNKDKFCRNQVRCKYVQNGIA